MKKAKRVKIDEYSSLVSLLGSYSASPERAPGTAWHEYVDNSLRFKSKNIILSFFQAHADSYHMFNNGELMTKNQFYDHYLYIGRSSNTNSADISKHGIGSKMLLALDTDVKMYFCQIRDGKFDLGTLLLNEKVDGKREINEKELEGLADIPDHLRTIIDLTTSDGIHVLCQLDSQYVSEFKNDARQITLQKYRPLLINKPDVKIITTTLGKNGSIAATPINLDEVFEHLETKTTLVNKKKTEFAYYLVPENVGRLRDDMQYTTIKYGQKSIIKLDDTELRDDIDPSMKNRVLCIVTMPAGTHRWLGTSKETLNDEAYQWKKQVKREVYTYFTNRYPKPVTNSGTGRKQTEIEKKRQDAWFIENVFNELMPKDQIEVLCEATGTKLEKRTDTPQSHKVTTVTATRNPTGSAPTTGIKDDIEKTGKKRTKHKEPKRPGTVKYEEEVENGKLLGEKKRDNNDVFTGLVASTEIRGEGSDQKAWKVVEQGNSNFILYINSDYKEYKFAEASGETDVAHYTKYLRVWGELECLSIVSERTDDFTFFNDLMSSVHELSSWVTPTFLKIRAR